MRNITKSLFVLTTIVFLNACAKDKTLDMNKAIPVELVATHAFKTDTPIKSLTFVPNNVAPWLGRLILLDTSGHIFSVDIEGRRALQISPKKYIDVFGLSLDNTAGVVLAVNSNNEIEAFLESDDNGNFSPMAYSGAPFSASAFCQSVSPISEGIKIRSSEGKVFEAKISVTQNVVEQTIGQEMTDTDTCHTSTSNKLIIPPLVRMPEQNFNPIAPIKAEENTTIDQPRISYTMRALNGGLITAHDQSGILYNLSINNGLSIRGITKVDYLTATTSNYGGAAFADGLIAMINHDEQRIVFLSREYVDRKLSEAKPQEP